MMSDICERIELWFALKSTYTDQEVRELLNDAQTEIERLRGENDMLRRLLQIACTESLWYVTTKAGADDGR
jgi:hypothetical protein